MYTSVKKIAIIEDNDDIRSALKVLLEGEGNYRVIGDYGSFEDANKTIKRLEPDVVLVDLQLPGLNGIEAIKILKEKLPRSFFLVITVFDDSQMVFDALCNGAHGYITKDSGISKIVNGIKEVLEGGAPMSSGIARKVIESFRINHDSPLSDRETLVLELLSKGKTYHMIADELHVHFETVKSHIKNIYRKLHVSNKADAISMALKNKYI